MERINSPRSKQSKCNLFADYILQKIGLETNTVIEVTDCNNFVVVNGITDSKDFLDLNSLIPVFNKKYEKVLEKPITHTFDFINYRSSVSDVENISSKFYLTSDNTKYHYSLVELYKNNPEKNFGFNGVKTSEFIEKEFLSSKSQFPHGYSLGQGRLLYYYGKYISYNLSGISLCVVLDIELSKNRNDNGSHLNLMCDMDLSTENIGSYIEDHFDFNYEKLKLKILDEDLSVEVLDPLGELLCVRENISPDPLI